WCFHGNYRASERIPDDKIEKCRDYKLITEVTQDGNDFSWTQIYYTTTRVTNKFTIGKECDMETKFITKATVQMEGGKLSTSFPNYQHVTEIVGDKLVESVTDKRDFIHTYTLEIYIKHIIK
uniref:Fatty acid binding protein 6, ileal (gastrotropin) n=1 Tax=Sphaeramia orbicularis TaxID=375764 RepID=A0A672YFN2_9TELE